MTRTRKRFIAGAECPACQAQDTLMLTIVNEQEQVQCVQCGHKFEERQAAAPAPATAQQPEKVPAGQVIGFFKPE